MSVPALVDTHCHLDVPRFDQDRAEVLARAFEAGLSGVIIPAIGPSSWDALRAYAPGAGVEYGLGIHPQLLPELDPALDDEHLARLDALLSLGGACAVGECGLDGASAAGAPMERQIWVLRQHFALSRKHGLPLLLHCLRSHPALLEVLGSESFPEAGILLHSYSGGAHLAATYAKAGCHFSLAGPVTFLDARKPLDALRAIPLDRLMLETDAPDQAPHPFRGQRCEPAHVVEVAHAAAQALGLPFEELAAKTTDNARRLFRRPFSR